MKKVVFCSALLVVGAGALHAQYLDVAADVGLELSHDLGGECPAPPISVGSAWGDYDDDGDVDLFAPNLGGPNRLYRNDGDTDFDGLPDFTDVAEDLGIDAPSQVSISAVFIDYDNDGDQDLYVTNFQGNTLWENQLTETGTATFLDVSVVAGLVDFGRAITSAWADFDGDGDLDVYLAKHRECPDFFNNRDSLYENNGDGTFTDVTTAYLCDGCDALEFGLGFAPGWVDYDHDRDLDLYVVNDAILEENHANVLWRNDGPAEGGGWTFTDVSVESGTDIRLNGMGLGIGDIDNDSFYEFAFSNVGANKLLYNEGDGTFTDISASAGIERHFLPGDEVSITWGTVFFDHDNDGLLDLYIVAGNIADLEEPVQTNAFFRNNGDLTFTDMSAASGLDHPGRARSASIVDFDEDGWMDVFVGNYGQAPVLFHNESLALGSGQNNWLRVSVEGTVDNRDGIGSKIRAVVPGGSLRQVRDITSGPTHGGGDERVAHFGLGSHESALVTVVWPNGAQQTVGEFAANQVIHLTQDIILGPAVPGLAGEINTFAATGAVPGHRVRMASSPTLGSRALPGCPGVSLGLQMPATRDTKRSNGLGEATLSTNVPPGLTGQTLYFQAWETTSCRVSNIVEVNFP